MTPERWAVLEDYLREDGCSDAVIARVWVAMIPDSIDPLFPFQYRSEFELEEVETNDVVASASRLLRTSAVRWWGPRVMNREIGPLELGLRLLTGLSPQRGHRITVEPSTPRTR